MSLGGLPIGIECEGLSARIFMPRNRALANVLFRLEPIEAYGTGIGRMRDSYAGEALKPEITMTANTFSIVLPNRNAPGERATESAGLLAEAAVRALPMALELELRFKLPSTFPSRLQGGLCLTL